MCSSILLGTKTEFLKYRHTSIFWLTLLLAAIIPATKVIACLINGDLYAMLEHRGQWQFFLMINWRDTSASILPIYIILLNNSIAQTEYKNNTWKQVYTLPRSYADIFFSKFILVQWMIFQFFIYFNLFYLMSGVLLFLLKGVPNFYLLPIPWKQMMIISIRVYIGALTMSAIQYWLSLRFRNFMIPIGAGLGLLIGSVLIGGWGMTFYAPHLLPLLMFFIDHSPQHYSLTLLYIISIGSFILILLLGFLDIYSLKEKG